MTFSFYQSLLTIPKELREASTIYQLTWWQRFVKLEVPFSMIGLVWNGMMSFGGGWFFLAASEAITVLNHQFYLPGIGSYMAVASERGDNRAIAWAIVTMIVIVLLVDQLFWRPIVAWSQKFKFEQTDSADEPTSMVLNLIRKSKAIPWLTNRLGVPMSRAVDVLFRGTSGLAQATPVVGTIKVGVSWLAAGISLLAVGYGIYHAFGVMVLSREITGQEVAKVLGYGLLTLLRVAIMVVFATAVWTPVGVAIGFSPKLSRIAQPLVQIGASFPANLLFPVVVLAFVALHIDLDWGSVILIALGTQWYILFNVIAGASSVPSDLREAATIFGLRGWNLWRTLILPAIFPAWVTGALTAAGGAWNASIVAEVVNSGHSRLEAHGLGRYITDATVDGDWPKIILGIGTMSIFVVLLNKLVWRRLYALGEGRFGLG
jgi:NitT/TauT family transport system permease protein